MLGKGCMVTLLILTKPIRLLNCFVGLINTCSNTSQLYSFKNNINKQYYIIQCQLINCPYHACAVKQIMPSINDIWVALNSGKEVCEIIADNDDTVYTLSFNYIKEG